MKEMAREEANLCEVRIPELEEEIKLLLVPADPQDDRNAILEIRGGTEVMKPPFLQATCSYVSAPNISETRLETGSIKRNEEQQEVLKKLSARNRR